MNILFKECGYERDMESQLRAIANGDKKSLSMQSANQIRHLKQALKEMISIVEIHSSVTGNNFAWAELEEAKRAIQN